MVNIPTDHSIYLSRANRLFHSSREQRTFKKTYICSISSEFLVAYFVRRNPVGSQLSISILGLTGLNSSLPKSVARTGFSVSRLQFYLTQLFGSISLLFTIESYMYHNYSQDIYTKHGISDKQNRKYSQFIYFSEKDTFLSFFVVTVKTHLQVKDFKSEPRQCLTC